MLKYIKKCSKKVKGVIFPNKKAPAGMQMTQTKLKKNKGVVFSNPKAPAGLQMTQTELVLSRYGYININISKMTYIDVYLHI